MEELKKIPTEQLVEELVSREDAVVLKTLAKGEGVLVSGTDTQPIMKTGTKIIAIYLGHKQD